MSSQLNQHEQAWTRDGPIAAAEDIFIRAPFCLEFRITRTPLIKERLLMANAE